jgi:diketogulonate reductase-like aldo/keto reductase
VIPKSVKPARLAENLDMFDFNVTAEQLAVINQLDTAGNAHALR